MQCIKTRIEWLKRIIAALTGTCIFGDAVTFINKDCRVLFGDIFIVPFLGPALGWTAMCSPGWGNLVAIDHDWNDLPVGREFYGKFLKNVKSPPHAMPPPLPPAGLTLIGALPSQMTEANVVSSTALCGRILSAPQKKRWRKWNENAKQTRILRICMMLKFIRRENS